MSKGRILSAALAVCGAAQLLVSQASAQELKLTTTRVTTQPAMDPPKKPPAPQLKLELDNGTSIRFGALTQLQYEAAGDYAGQDVAQNIYMRRMMLLLGGNILKDFEYFIDTDFVDMLKANTKDGIKSGPGFSLKDVLMTWKAAGDALRIDGGLMLPPLSRTSLQGAPFLLGLDFFANAYTHAAAFGNSSNSFGRDMGLQLRGLVLKDRLEYRLGVFQGKRNAADAKHVASNNAPRVAGRVSVNLLDPENVFFLRGTYLGEKRIASLGGYFDVQHADAGTYRSWGADLLVDVAGVTVQADYVHRHGGSFVKLSKSDVVMVEGGYLIRALMLTPIARVERRWGSGTTIDETDIGGGLSWFVFNHSSNLKVYYIRGVRDIGQDYDQFNAQWQLFFY